MAKIQRQLKKDDRNMYNILRSIIEDNEFLENIKSKFPSDYPLVANLRCGLWYSPTFDYTCYFKSTDGHHGHWQFNLSRLNLAVVKIAIEHGGAIIVDSTRKGKHFPDSFNRTIPIWTCVINRALHQLKKEQTKNNTKNNDVTVTDEYDWHSLHMPPWISPSEQSQVEERLPKFVEKLLGVLHLTPQNQLDELLALKKPLKAVCVNPETKNSELKVNWIDAPYTPIICLSVSMVTNDGMQKKSDYTYIQGAADDHESWAEGLTPKIFWENSDLLLSSKQDIYENLREILEEEKLNIVENINTKDDDEVTEKDELLKKVYYIGDSGMAIGSSVEGTSEVVWEVFDAVLNCSMHNYEKLSTEENAAKYLHLPAEEKKKDKNKLSKILPEAIDFVFWCISSGKKILIHAYEDIDTPACIAFAVIIKYFDNSIKRLPEPRTKFDKQMMRNLFFVISSSCPEARPSRTMMNDINRFFLTPPNLQSRVMQEFIKQKEQKAQEKGDNNNNENNSSDNEE